MQASIFVVVLLMSNGSLRFCGLWQLATSIKQPSSVAEDLLAPTARRHSLHALHAEQREFSPILFAALLAGGVTAGAILLNSGVVISEQAVTGVLRSGTLAGQEGGSSGSSGIAIDDNTRLLLNLALGLGGLGSLVIGESCLTTPLAHRERHAHAKMSCLAS